VLGTPTHRPTSVTMMADCASHGLTTERYLFDSLWQRSMLIVKDLRPSLSGACFFEGHLA
jgi:hypothetical protein